MANTYTQIHIQAVFGVKYRTALITPNWQHELYKYITGIIQQYNHKLLAINGMPDHVHIFFGMRPTQALSKLIQQVKEDSTKWINEQGFVRDKFQWQEGFGAFSYSRSQISSVCKYVENQKEHHQKKSFLDEYVEMLKAFEIEYDERFIFKNPV
ncbi:MAG: IS200/IS605 family transposase [Saprospiraceae bacterium]